MMNYMKEINAFHIQNMFDPLSGSAVALWSVLMHVNNLCGWKKEFTVAATQLQTMAGLKSTAFKLARKELQEKGRIIVTSRGANRAAMYQMISQQMDYTQEDIRETDEAIHKTKHIPVSTPTYSEADQPSNTEARAHSPKENFSPKSTPTSLADFTNSHIADKCTNYNDDHNHAHTLDHTPDPFFKQDSGKQKQDNTTATTDAIRFYQENFGIPSPFIMEDILSWSKDVSEPLVLYAMKLALEQDKTTWRYVKAILQAWAKKNITTVDAAINEEQAYRNKQHTFVTSRMSSTTEVIPDWFKKQKQQEAKRKTETSASTVKKDPAEEQRELEALLAKYAGSGT
ncbi:DnaD domain-containing protein [Virgibacillus halodenitrificans]|uniref:DnaD domain-containing protein n=1 Tax=Virgibacillus halodenitrificans TaxID=1482 RepID=UPI0002F60712|nr:DnaD domain protein [Virgibacillus halodenitrificans]